MKSGKYTLKELFTNIGLGQIVVPEIQRDYIWSKEQVISLLTSLIEDFEKNKNASFKIDSDDDNIRELFKAFYKKQKYSTNIGFVYAYNDIEYADKYFLIDGQQRLTTMYLLLLALTIENNENRNDFKNHYFPKTNNASKGLLKLDYKVRESAHDFFQRLVTHILEEKKIDDVVNQYWYFDEYKSDATIRSLLENLETIIKDEKIKDIDYSAFYSYIQNFVELWYFDTNISEQGEELYIFMNARGEQTQTNENMKAELLGSLIEDGLKNYWGIKWEDWQDFFWQNKGKDNENADVGFNEFLDCITGLNKFANNSHVNLYVIEKYYIALTRIVNHVSVFEWEKKCQFELLKIINTSFTGNENKDTDWFCFKDENKRIDHSRMAFVWSIIEYLSSENRELDQDLALSNKDIRVLRLFWIRYQNDDKSIAKFFERIASLKKENGLFGIDNTFLNDEESKKHNYYNFLKLEENSDFSDSEQIIWIIEDHPYNTGYDSVTISHLIDLSLNPSIDILKKAKSKFYDIFPIDNNTPKPDDNLKSLLLYSSTDENIFWNRVTPWYYENYDCSDWKRNIRGKYFFKIFDMLLKSDLSIDQLLLDKEKEFWKNTTIDLLKQSRSYRIQIIVYQKLIPNIWEKGNISFYGRIEDNTRRIFDNELRIYKAHRYYDNSKELWEEVKINLSANITIDILLQNIINSFKN